jgi:hypothetical protein
VSTFRPSFSPQSNVYPQLFASCNPGASKSPFVFNRLRTLYLSCRSFCDSFPLFSITSALLDKNTRGSIPSSPSAPTGSNGFNTHWVRFPSAPLPHLRPLLRIHPLRVSTFRINTCKSVTKQTTLTSFRINTCEKPRGRGGHLSQMEQLACPYGRVTPAALFPPAHPGVYHCI